MWWQYLMVGAGVRRQPEASELIAMLLVFKRTFRIKAAIAATLLYAVCVLAPSAALAFSPQAAHCLTETQGAAHVHRDAAQATPHIHADGTDHAHADSSGAQDPSHTDDKARSGNCCGLFCVSALASEPAAALLAPPTCALDGPTLTFRLDGHEPGRLHRPPIG
jgi:hypothetical protein